jgi:hypothetical protein
MKLKEEIVEKKLKSKISSDEKHDKTIVTRTKSNPNTKNGKNEKKKDKPIAKPDNTMKIDSFFKGN